VTASDEEEEKWYHFKAYEGWVPNQRKSAQQ
jgi:hypothetical protein